MKNAREMAALPHCLSIVPNKDEHQSTDGRKDPTSARLFTAFCMLAASPATIAHAQQAAEPADELPPLVVETSGKKKKSAATKKAVTTSPAPQLPPAVEPVAERPQTPPLPGQAGPVARGAYNAEYSTSNKFTGPLLDTPQTVTVIPGTIISERGATNLTQALRNTPGITFDAGENGFATSINNFKIRGIDTSGSIFVDGVRNSGSFARDMFNVEQIEVIKGAAADNGRGGAAGYVNIITKTPTTENFIRGESSLTFDEHGTDPLFRSTVDVNQRSGTVAVRMNGMYEDGGVMGRDVAELNAYGLAPSLAFGLGTDTRAIFSYERLERNDIPDWGVPGAMMDGFWNYNSAAARASRDNFYGLRSDYDDVEGDRVMARLEHDISSSVTITNQTVWENANREARYTIPTGYEGNGVPAGHVNSQMQFYDRENTTFSNQTNLSARFQTGAFRHTVSTGVEYSREQSDANRFGTIGCTGNGAVPAFCTPVLNPDPGRIVIGSLDPDRLSPTERNAVEIETVAGYFYDTIQLTRQLEFVGGLRVEHYKVEIDSIDAVTGLPVGLENGTYEDSETTLSGKIGLVYKPVREGTLYASYGVSALPPGSFLSNPDISRTGDNAFPGFVAGAEPVEAQNYEVGVKWDFFGGRLSTTAAAFHTVKDNVPITGCSHPTDVIDCTDLELLKGYGEQRVQGIELGIAGNLTDRWKVFGGLTVLDTERRHSAYLDEVKRNLEPGDYEANPDAGFAGATRTSGDELAFTPNFFANLWMTYDVTDKFTLGGGVLYVGDSWFGRPDDALRIIPNGKFGKLPDYFLVNFMAAYDLTDNVALQFNIDNVFDEEYAVSANWGASRATLGAPRTFRIGTNFDF